MKKIFTILLFLTLTTCVYANEQTVLNDALAAFNSSTIPAQDRLKCSQTDKYLTGLLIVQSRYIAQFRGEDLVDTGKLILRYHPNTTIWKDNGIKLIAQFIIVYGYTMEFDFVKAHNALEQMAVYKSDKDYPEMYKKASENLALIEQYYDQARKMGYQTPAEQRRAIMKKMGY